MSTAPTTPAFGRHVVTAVLVAHDGARWLPSPPPGCGPRPGRRERFVAVDTGQHRRVRRHPRPGCSGRTGSSPRRSAPGSAPRSTSAWRPPTSGPPRPTRRRTTTARRAISRCSGCGCCTTTPSRSRAHSSTCSADVDSSPTVAVAGPKLRGWSDRRTLLEVGVTIARSGRRETGLERREQDQGQHDGVRDVLAVSTAGHARTTRRLGRAGRPRPGAAAVTATTSTSAGGPTSPGTGSCASPTRWCTTPRRPRTAGGAAGARSPALPARRPAARQLRAAREPAAAARAARGAAADRRHRAAGPRPARSASCPPTRWARLLALARVLARPDRLARARWRRRRTRAVPYRVRTPSSRPTGVESAARHGDRHRPRRGRRCCQLCGRSAPRGRDGPCLRGRRGPAVMGAPASPAASSASRRWCSRSRCSC